MKRTLIAFSLFFALGSTLLLAQPEPRRFSNRLLNDVVQMTRAGLADDTIVAYVTARRTRLDGEVSADDLIALRRAGVHENVVRAIAGMTGLSDEPSGRDLEIQSDSRSGEVGAQPAEGEDVAVPARPYPYWYAYGWYAYPYGWGWGYPYFSTAIVFRGGGFGHRFFGHGGFRGGGGGHRGGRR